MVKRSDLRREVVESTRGYEAWLARRGPVVLADLRLKHRRMAESPFPFFRATFYRWVELWRRLGGEARDAPRMLAVGDLHVENFGTWRDAEGRLVWGVNDLDEAHPAPYTIDLARLAASARLAADEGHLALGLSEACEAILEGYRAGLRAGGEPFVLADRHPWRGEARCWVSEALRRLAPDCARVELADLPARRDEARLLRNMGRETAKVHLGSPGARARILRHLARQRPGWLRALARDLADATVAEAESWRAHQRRGGR